jgi:hypothetical protein
VLLLPLSLLVLLGLQLLVLVSPWVLGHRGLLGGTF